MKKWFPLVLTAILAVWIARSISVPKDKPEQFATQEFGRLPIVHNGRVQPLDSLARNSLMQLREKQSVYRAMTEEELAKRSWIQKLFGTKSVKMSTAWLMEMMMKPDVADSRAVFRIDNPDLKGLLALPMEADEAKGTDGKHFAWTQVRMKLEALQNEARRIEPPGGKALDPSQRTPFDKAVMRLWNNVGIYMQLQNALQPQNAREWRKELDTYVENIPAGVTAARAQQQGQEYNKEALDRLVDDLGRFDAMLRLNGPLLVPPADHPGHNHTKDDWLRMGQALMDMARGEPPHFAVMAYADMASAFRNGRTAEFNQGVSSYRTALGSTFGPELEKAASEQRFNFFEPFYKAMTPYVLAFVLVLVFWLNPARFDFLRRTAFWLVMLALVVHTAGLIYRMVLEGRPPVTNLYSSAIFIGWGAVVLGLILEAFWRNGIGIIIGSVLGFITLIIAHHLALSGDTMEMMRAVLDTNFWLATHVVIITLGYSATFVAGFLAIVFILRGVLTSGLDGPTAKGLGKMVYGIICFATLFSFVGTVLGGIWADQSWGRFWGWDAKENGALMIVLWNALILHARWGGLVRERGLMNLAIGGNIVTAWSWFGVNMLGIGLHSYGFMDAAFWWLLGFAISQLALIALGSLPLRMWRSFRGTPQNVPPPADALPA